MSVFRKHDDGPVSTALEAQGLAWLAEAMADGGAHVAICARTPTSVRRAAGSVSALGPRATDPTRQV